MSYSGLSFSNWKLAYLVLLPQTHPQNVFQLAQLENVLTL